MAVPAVTSHSPLESLARITSGQRPTQTPLQPQRQPWQQVPPASPLLHSRFARDSTATASSMDNNSYLARASVDSRNISNEPTLQHRYYDEESIYSTSSAPGQRDSWQSSNTRAQDSELPHEGLRPTHNQTMLHQPPPVDIPTVIVSLPTDPDGLGPTSHPGRVALMKPMTSNFSRPRRPPIVTTPESEEQKRRVLERNQKRTGSPTPSIMLQNRSNPVTGGAGQRFAENWKSSSQSPLRFEAARSPSPQTSPWSSNPPVLTRSLSPFLRPSSGRSSPSNLAMSLRPVSPGILSSSLYSVAPSPPGVTFLDPPLDPYALRDDPRPAPSPPTPQPGSSRTPGLATSDPRTPQEYLQLGIQHHEANRLKESATCFEKSATVNGGCGMGMLMWGLALRHGWGCEKNEKGGFKWLRHAAESAVSDLENARIGGGVDTGAVQVLVAHISSGSSSLILLRLSLCLQFMRSGSVSFKGGA